MIRMKGKNIAIISALYFILALICGYFFPGHAVAEIGFTIAIIISFFAADPLVTGLGIAGIFIVQPSGSFHYADTLQKIISCYVNCNYRTAYFIYQKKKTGK